MLSRSDLDPRVLSNAGWGQTQIRQNVAWDLDTKTKTGGVGNRNERGISSASSTFSSSSMNTTTSRGAGYPSNPGSMTTDPSPGTHMAGGNTGSMRDSQPARSPQMPVSVMRKPASPVGDLEGSQGKVTGGWGERPPESKGKGWGSEEKEWGDHRGGGPAGGGGNWREFGEQGSGWGGGPEDKGTGGWKEMRAGGWIIIHRICNRRTEELVELRYFRFQSASRVSSRKT